LPDDEPEPLFHEWSHPPEYEPVDDEDDEGDEGGDV
jgi:hypothetical protein